jgi:pimeloyl-ACP methyl ester carboxylesterase
MVWSGDTDLLTGSQIMLNVAPPEKAVVFVHGWGGSAARTWAEFPSAIRALPEAASADAFFLNYPSRSVSVATAGRDLQVFLEHLLRTPATNIVNLSLPEGEPRRPEQLRYTRIVLVGHSMGAVVARRALLNLDRADPPQRLTPGEAACLRLLLFAPAHLGSSLPNLVASGLGLDWLPGASMVGQLVTHYFRSLQDLHKGSEALTQLLKDNETARARRATNQVADADLHAFVLHARNDKVVVQDRFDEDTDGRPIAGRHHRNACKPDEQYRRPIEELRRIL